jgi:hypothetical protein
MMVVRGVFRNFLWGRGAQTKFKVYIVITFPSQKTVVCVRIAPTNMVVGGSDSRNEGPGNNYHCSNYI